MSKVCEVCGKHPVAGRSISHSHRVTNRKFRPNIQRVYVVVDGHRRKIKGTFAPPASSLARLRAPK